MDNALRRALPALGKQPWVSLGDWPTPVEPLDGVAAARGLPAGVLWAKREDISARGYGGNKIRTLEAMFGQAVAAGATQIYATGAYGSNHALATVVHAPRAGLEAGVLLFPQPPTETALANLRATLSLRPRVTALPHWSLLPFGVALTRRRAGSFVMLPGGAVPEGALGHVAAAFELCEQIDAGVCPAPRRIFVGTGSTCTAAGLLCGLALAVRMGRLRAMPELWAVRVTPWPVTSKLRIVGLAQRAAVLLEQHAGGVARFTRAELSAHFQVTGSELGRGYGHTTASGLRAIELFREHGGPALDTVYSGKVAAAVLARPSLEPTIMWASKSSLPLPENRPGRPGDRARGHAQLAGQGRSRGTGLAAARKGTLAACTTG